MKAEQLWASILQEAIQGRLVPQLESEPEVTQIGKAPNEVPFEIPEKWKWVQLGNIGRWKAGGTPSRSNKDYYNNGTIPWLKTGDLTDGLIKRVEEYITDEALKNSSAHINPKGSVLIAMYGATIGKLGLLEFPCATNQACCACDVNTLICDRWYLFYFLESQRKEFIAKGAGGAQPNISRTKIVNHLIPLPPIEEQKRIVARIQILRPLIELYKQEEKQLEVIESSFPKKLRASILQEAIQGKLVPQLESEPAVEQIGKAPEDVPFAIPEKWKWCNFGNVVAYGKCEQVQPQNIEKSAWILDLEDIKSGTGNLLQKKKGISAQSNKTRFRKGDVLYSKLRPYLNKVIVADDDGYCTTEIVPISPSVAQAPLDAQYLKIYLMSPYFVGYANQCSYGVKMPRLGTKDAQKALFPIPPIEEQCRIVAKLNELLSYVTKIGSPVSTP